MYVYDVLGNFLSLKTKRIISLNFVLDDGSILSVDHISNEIIVIQKLITLSKTLKCEAGQGDDSYLDSP